MKSKRDDTLDFRTQGDVSITGLLVDIAVVRHVSGDKRGFKRSIALHLDNHGEEGSSCRIDTVIRDIDAAKLMTDLEAALAWSKEDGRLTTE